MTAKKVELQQKFFDIENELNQFIFCRQNVIRDSILALLTKQHLCMIGEPGIAKSYVIDEIMRRIDLSKFGYLNTPFTKPVEVSGPVDSKHLRDTGRMKIFTDGYLPSVEVCFGDETWNAENYLNMLLKILNERRFTNGNQEEVCPLITYFGASNKFPEKGLEALWDRFLFRMIVERIDNPVDKRKYHIAAANRVRNTTNVTVVTKEEFYQAMQEVSNVKITEETVDAYLEILQNLHLFHDIQVSDRRETWVYNAVRGIAWLAGRTSSLPEDLTGIAQCLWYDWNDMQVIRKEVCKIVNPEADDILTKLDRARLWESRFHKTENYIAGSNEEEDPNKRKSENMQSSTPVTVDVAFDQVAYILRSLDNMKVAEKNKLELLRVKSQLNAIQFGFKSHMMKNAAAASRQRR